MFLNSLIRLTVVASVTYCSFYDRPWQWWIPLLLIAIFIVRGVVAAEGDAERIDCLADQVYFLSFAGTLGALLGLLVQIRINGEATSEDSVEMVGAIAVLTILFGILSMATLREYGQKLSDQGSPLKSAAV